MDKANQARLAKDFNAFYLKITGRDINQIGNYEIIEEIGEGAFGKVYLANHVLLNMPVVLKCGEIEDPNLIREIYYHKQLKHRNIVKLYEVIKTETHLWLVMEYCQGNELYYYIYEKKRISVKECKQIFWQIINAIKYVHSLNLVHRDLKLENILFADKKQSLIKLTDFGFVREFSSIKRNFLSTMCGTTVYMAPEVLKGEKYSGVLTDIWSLGVILYTMLYGKMPFEEDDELRTKYKIIHDEPICNDDIPASAINLIKRMLNKDPMLRPSTNDIINSEFLIDITNKYPEKLRRSSSMHGTDSESIMSISQYQNSGILPFQSKIGKKILKHFQKADITTDRLQNDINNNEMNSLTAFYELVLTKEFHKKKKYYKRSKRARRSLSKSKRRVKSALSLSDDGNQPLEKIMSSLSINSRSQSKTNLPNSNTRNSSELKRPITDNFPPFNRTVSFYTTPRKSSISSALDLNNGKHHGKLRGGFKNRIQFWKRKDDEYNSKDNFKDQVSEVTVSSPSPKTVIDVPVSPSMIHKRNVSDQPSIIIQTLSDKKRNVGSSCDNSATNSKTRQGSSSITETIETPKSRTRPSSMISQISQISHLSQLSTMMSESELELLGESDSMDDFEEELYDSSINNSAYDINRRRNHRPSYKRQVSSDVSIASFPTNTTNKHSHPRKASLIHLSSNSSDDDSSDIISPVSTAVNIKVGKRSQRQLPSDNFAYPLSIPRPSSPPPLTMKYRTFKSRDVKGTTVEPISEE